MQDSLTQIMETIWEFLPNLLGALAILIGGWLVARILGALVRGALKRTNVDNRLAGWVAPDAKEPFATERMAGKLVYYLVMLFVLVAFFEALNLDLITQPLNALLTEVGRFAPRLLGALGLLILAWILATVLRRLVAGALTATRLDERLGEMGPDERRGEMDTDADMDAPGGTGPETDKGMSLSHSLAEAVYWLVFLLFLPAILSTLAIEGLLAPVQEMATQVLAFLPNLFAALVILGVGWFVARLVSRIVANLLAAAGTDSLMEEGMGGRSLSDLIGIVVYVLILIPVVIASLNALQMEAITTPASAMLENMLAAIPGIFAAALILIIAFMVGRLVSGLVANILEGAGFNELPARLGLKTVSGPGGRSPSEVVGFLVLLGIMVFAAIEASSMMGFATLADILGRFIVFAGQVALGLVVFVIGLWIANMAATAIRSSAARGAPFMAVVARVSILALAGAMGLREMGVGEQIIELAFGLLLGAVAVAAALAFGLGARETAGEQVKEWLSRRESATGGGKRTGGGRTGGGQTGGGQTGGGQTAGGPPAR
ncbi:MAG: mechanosensitive ion channel [Longimicrobiales bacterium]